MYFYKGSKNILAKLKPDETEVETVRKEILKAFDVKNLSFLLGAGCSSYYKDKDDIGIPVMSFLAKEFYKDVLKEADKKYIAESLKIDINSEPFSSNLEKLLEVLYSYRFLLKKQKQETTDINNLIAKVTKFLLQKCINQENNDKHTELVDLYKRFYKKLIYRDTNLTKANIFTTNYDLYSETALDKLGILYTNGFTGLTERYFNPIVFNYAYAEQMELSNSKWNVIDNFVYLYKLHGSINWIESNSSSHPFKVEELQKVEESRKNVMIYPTPMKQIVSFASPYSDLFREFQKKLMREKNALIVIGYSFSDEHINNLIYQALTIPTFRLIIFQDPDEMNILELRNLDDPRIWIIGGENDGNKTHYFNHIVDELLPDIDEQKIEDSIDKVVSKLLHKSQP